MIPKDMIRVVFNDITVKFNESLTENIMGFGFKEIRNVFLYPYAVNMQMGTRFNLQTDDKRQKGKREKIFLQEITKYYFPTTLQTVLSFIDSFEKSIIRSMSLLEKAYVDSPL